MDSKWFFKWKGDEHSMFDRAKARSVAKGNSQVKELRYVFPYSISHV